MPSLQLCCSAHDGAPRPYRVLKARPVSIAWAYDLAPGRPLMTAREIRPEPGWTNHLDSVPPTVLILGGFLTGPPMYRRLVERLGARGAAGVVVANVWPPDWLIAGVRGVGPLTTRSGRALHGAWRLSRDVSRGAPLLVVGHSAGGITARLLTAREPFPGRRFGAALFIGAIVSLGTPHRLATGEGIGRRLSEVAAATADEGVDR